MANIKQILCVCVTFIGYDEVRNIKGCSCNSMPILLPTDT